MQDPVVARVNYFDRQFLGTDDFAEEQAYHLALHRRHNIAHHIWGIVEGLEILQDMDAQVTVQPGLAIDGYGRELVLGSGTTIAPDDFTKRGTDTLEVWLVYDRVESEAAPRARAECTPNGRQAMDRVHERGRVELRRANTFDDFSIQPIPAHTRPLPDVPSTDIPFEATRTPPDDPARRWPVYLGAIQRSPAEPPAYTISRTGRPYVGLVGQAVVHPAYRGKISTQIHFGSGVDGEDSRFEILLHNPDHTSRGGAVDAHLERRLRLDGAGDWYIRGDTEVVGDVLVDGGMIEFGAGPAYLQAMPWRIYHAAFQDEQSDQNGQSGQNKQSEPFVDELRIEMGNPGSVVIGKWSQDNSQFEPCLTIDSDCTVTVHGDLVVNGTIDDENGNIKHKGESTRAAPSAAAKAIAAAAQFSGLTGVLNAQRLAPLLLVEPAKATPSQPPADTQIEQPSTDEPSSLARSMQELDPDTRAQVCLDLLKELPRDERSYLWAGLGRDLRAKSSPKGGSGSGGKSET